MTVHIEDCYSCQHLATYLTLGTQGPGLKGRGWAGRAQPARDTELAGLDCAGMCCLGTLAVFLYLDRRFWNQILTYTKVKLQYKMKVMMYNEMMLGCQNIMILCVMLS